MITHDGSYDDCSVTSLGDIASSNDDVSLEDYSREQCFEVILLPST